MQVAEVLAKLRNNDSQHLILAVSGGVDSMVLAALVKAAGVEKGRVTIAHFNHELQQNSEAVESLVSTYAKTLGFEFVTASWKRESKDSVSEAQAREARLAFLLGVAHNYADATVVFAHQQDEQVETVLFRLARSGRAASVAGLREVDTRAGVTFWRPLLGVSKEDLYTYACANDVPFLEDPSNADESYTRNYLRHTVVPALQEVNTRLADHVTRFTTELEALQTLAQKSLERLMPKPKESVDWRDFLSESEAVQRLLLQRFLDAHKLTATDKVKDALLAALQEASGTTGFDLQGARVEAAYGVLGIAKESVLLPEMTLSIKTGWQAIPEGKIGVFEQLPEGAQELASVPPDVPVILRHAEQGDTLRLANGQHQRVRRFWINRKIPLSKRKNAWVAVADKTVVWASGASLSELFQKSQTDIISAVLAFKPNKTKAGQ